MFLETSSKLIKTNVKIKNIAQPTREINSFLQKNNKSGVKKNTNLDSKVGVLVNHPLNFMVFRQSDAVVQISW